MPITLYTPKGANASGISITWTKSRANLYLSGWYDGSVGIQGTSLSLAEFFNKLGITKADCDKVWKQLPNNLTMKAKS